MLGLEIRSVGLEGPDDEYRFDAVLSDKSLDALYTRMSDKTLDNFAAQAEGKPFMDSHIISTHKQIGYVVSGKRDGDVVAANIAILRDADDTPADMKTSEFIRRIEKRMLRGVSVGFTGGRAICDTCGEDIRSNPQCTHLPSREHTFTIDDANLKEVSITPVPANENSYILNRAKAEPEKEVDAWGALYRKNVVEEALTEGVRCHGAAFNQSEWEKRLEGMEPEIIMALTREWKTTADKLFGEGRSTKDNYEVNSRVILPDVLFR